MEVIVGCCLLILFCTSCSLISNVDIVALPDPFMQPPRGAVVRHAEHIVLEAVVELDGKLGAALACDQAHEMLTVGEKFRGFTVVNISDVSVTLTKGKKQRVLRLN